ncbi:MAG TPA: MATE family efflux transporter [Vicinamibacterales bacterium]|nr:MATE family efflux transporter [Vicinamibacterales bacterium]
MTALAWPVVVAEIGWLAMGIVDTIMVAPLGPAAIGAVGAGSILFMALMMPGFGTLLALDTFVARSFGAGRIDECHRWLFAGVQLAIVMTVVLTVVAFLGVRALPAVGFHPDVIAALSPYMTSLLWSVAPLMLYIAMRRYLQAMNVVRPIMAGLIIANAINLGANWLLVEGRLGFPALGVVGAAYATVVSRVFLGVFTFVVLLRRERDTPSGLHDVPFAIDVARVWAILKVGLPAAGQILLEVGVFATASALAGKIAPAAVAAHQIVLNIAGFVFMFPYGISSAAAVRVGQAMGRHDAHGVRLAGWGALGLATSVMMISAALFALTPRPFMRLFTDDVSVVEAGAAVLLIAAVFQLFDGVQTVTTGALRGLGETRMPMYSNLIGHWMIGLPTGYVLCFRLGWGIEGLWMGLALGLILVGSVLLGVWSHKSRAAVVPVKGL